MSGPGLSAALLVALAAWPASVSSWRPDSASSWRPDSASSWRPASAGPQLAQPAPPARSGADHVIHVDAIAAVRSYAQFTIFDDVWLDVNDGVVRVGGKVTQPIKKHDIARRLADVAGVRSVVNELSVLPVSRFDDQLRDSIARAIYGHAQFWNYAVMPNPPIHIIVERSRVTLTGVVRTEADRLLARTLALQSQALSVAVELKTDAELRDAQ